MALLSSSKKTEVIEKEGRALQLFVAESSIQIDDDQAHEIFLRSVIAIEFFEERSADLGDGFEVSQVCQPREFLTDHELPLVFHPEEV